MSAALQQAGAWWCSVARASAEALRFMPSADMKTARVNRKTEVTKKPCGCCGGQAILTLTAPGRSETPPLAPVTLCAECIIALAQALAEQR